MSRGRFRLLRGIAGLLGAAGVIPLLAGLVSNVSQHQWGLLSLLPVIIGGALVLAGLGANLPAIIRGIVTKKALIGTNVIVMVLAAAGILGFASYLNARHYKRFDVTHLRRYTLSEQSVNILKGLKEPVRITTLFTRASSPPLLDEIMDLLQEYDYLSDKVQVEHIDAFYEQDKVQQLATKLNTDLSGISVNSVIFQCGDRRKDVPYADIVKQEAQDYRYYSNPEPPQLNAEAAFTSALLSVAEPRQTEVYFLVGHGERSVDDYEAPGLSEVARELKRQNFKVEQLNPLETKEIPADAGLLIMPSLGAPLSNDVIESLGKYLAGGGKLLVMLEPLTAKVKESGIGALLADYGIMTRTDLEVVNYMGTLLGTRLFSYEIVVSGYSPHKITEGLQTRGSVFSGVCMVAADPSAALRGYKASVLMRAPVGAWGETGYAGDPNLIRYDTGVDEKGPVPFAVAVEPGSESSPRPLSDYPGNQDEETPPGPKLVVFGDVDFISNALINQPGNLDLFLNSVNWLAGKETHLGIGPKEPEQRVANLTPRNVAVIYWLTVSGLPALCIFLGALVWLVRRL